MPGFGETLRDARLSRGLTHDYVSQIIKIRPEFLQALEDEDLSVLPGIFYARNFLRRYADYLGLDASSLLDQLAAHQATLGSGQAPVSLAGGRRAPRTSRHWSPDFGLAATIAVLGVATLALAYRVFLMPAAPDATDGARAVTTPGVIAVAQVPTQARRPAATSTPTAVRALPTPTATREAEPTPRPRRKKNRPRPRATSTPTRPPIQARSGGTGESPSGGGVDGIKRVPTPAAEPTNTPLPTRTPTPEPTETPAPTETERPTATPETETDSAITASVRTSAATTVTVLADGETAFQGTMAPGRTSAYGAESTLYIYSESAPDVLVAVNGCARRSLESYGCPGCLRAYYTFTRRYDDCR